MIVIVAGRKSSGERSFEELLVDRVPGGRYRVAAAPGLANGLAAGDVIEYDAGSRAVTVVERGGNLCVQVYGPHRVPEEFVATHPAPNGISATSTTPPMTRPR